MKSNNGNYIKSLEEDIAKFVGAKYAVAVDSGSNALFLLLKHLHKKPIEIITPCRTYMSVPMTIINAGHMVRFIKYDWDGFYQLLGTNIIDACNLFKPYMYADNTRGDDQYMFISFQQKKTCGVEKGGMIFTNSEESAKVLRRMAFDGRDYLLGANDDNGIILGYHMNMTPDTAVKIHLKFNTLNRNNWGSFGGSHMYRDLTKMECFDE